MEQSGLDSKKAPKVASQLRVCNPFSTAVPTWGQTTQILSGSSSPKRDCSSIGWLIRGEKVGNRTEKVNLSYYLVYFNTWYSSTG